MKKVKVATCGMVREVELEEISIQGIEQYIQKSYSNVHTKMTLNANNLSAAVNGSNLYGQLIYICSSECDTVLIQVFDISYSKLLNTLNVNSIYMNKYDIERIKKMDLTA